MRVGVIGTGFGERVVAPSYAATPGVTVVDVVSPRDDAGALALCRRPDVDLVSVHSPPFLHRRHVEAAMASGHHVLCDKPFGLDASDARAMADAAAVAGVVALCNFEFRLHPARALLRSMVADGELGDLEHVSWVHLLNGARDPLRPHGWLFDRASGGGWIGAWASHVVDALRWWTGAEPGAVAGVLLLDLPVRPDRSGAPVRCTAEDGCSVVLELGGGATAAVDATFVAPASLPQRVVLSGSAGVVEVVGDRTVTVRPAGRGPRREHEVPPVPGDPHLGPMLAMAAMVRDAVGDGFAPPGAPTFADGLACAEVLERLRALPMRVRPEPADGGAA